MSKNATDGPLDELDEREAPPVQFVDVRERLHRFQLINRERVNRVRQMLSPTRRRVLDLLPLLFHSNYPLFPGYAGDAVPCGVAEYRPTTDALNAARRLARAYDYKRSSARSVDIHALFLMGSSGTVAYSSSSDFDIWVCHRPGLSSDEHALLQQKCDGIREWARSVDVDMHLFLMVAEEFRNQGQAALGRGSSGSAQRMLLLDEFYRTGLLLSGRYPLWWLVPAEHDGDYLSYARALRHYQLVSKHEYVDFGPIEQIPANEFLSASMWQLAQAIHAPHKSLLKLMLLEVYTANYPAIALLSSELKRAAESGEVELNSLDPYVMLLRAIEQYLGKLGDDTRLDLARRSFYFKVNERLSVHARRAAVEWRRELMQEIVAGWGWDKAQILEVDQRQDWKIDRVVSEHRDLVAALTHSYRMLTRFAATHDSHEQRPSEADMTVLGRQLYAVYESRSGKLELVNHGVSHDLSEPHLIIRQQHERDGMVGWVAFRSEGPQGYVEKSKPIRRARTLLELVAWCHFNGVLARHTSVTLGSTGHPVTVRDVDAICMHLRVDFPTELAASVDIQAFSQPARVLKAGVFINVGVDPMERYSRQGKTLTSAQVDALNYGAFRENLVRVIEYLVLNSWGEITVQRHEGIDGLLRCVCDHARRVIAAGSVEAVPPVASHAFSSSYTVVIATRIAALFEHVAIWAQHDGGVSRSRYIMQGQASFYVLLRDGGGVRHDFSGEYAELLEYLGEANAEPTPVTVDEEALHKTVLPPLYAAYAPGHIVCAYELVGETAELYVLDEHGALFTDSYEFFTEAALVSQLTEFLDAVQYRQAIVHSESHTPYQQAPVSMFKILRSRAGEAVLRRVTLRRHSVAARAFYVQASAAVIDGDVAFTLYSEDGEFSSLEFGRNVYARIREHILARRRTKDRYRLYLTDIDLSQLPFDDTPENSLRTIHYLHYKKQIEDKLNHRPA